jgi:hypothetical protein
MVKKIEPLILREEREKKGEFIVVIETIEKYEDKNSKYILCCRTHIR